MARFLSLLAVVGLLPLTGYSQTFDHSHAAFDAVLRVHVAEERVDYKALKAAPTQLVGYLDELAKVKRADFDAWNKAQQQAFAFNLYNAATLKLIVDHYPVKSIKDIGGFFSGPWKQEVVRLWGKVVTLDHLEHEIIRPTFNEPRAHFALVCAAKGCPPLRAEAYVAEKLEQQLDDQGRVFLASRAKNYVDAKNKMLYVSPIFDWFEEDFTAKAGTVEKFLLPYWPAPDHELTKQGGFSLDYTSYDWSLNDKP